MNVTWFPGTWMSKDPKRIKMRARNKTHPSSLTSHRSQTSWKLIWFRMQIFPIILHLHIQREQAPWLPNKSLKRIYSSSNFIKPNITGLCCLKINPLVLPLWWESAHLHHQDPPFSFLVKNLHPHLDIYGLLKANPVNGNLLSVCAPADILNMTQSPNTHTRAHTFPWAFERN